MTEEEADALDEKLTRTTPKRTAADYILTRALATRKTPAQIISELVEERIAASI